MTKNQKADDLQIKPLDETAPVSTQTEQRSDPRVTSFLERLREKAEALDIEQRKNHVTPKEPRRRAVVDQAANPDWYQPKPKSQTQKKTAPDNAFSKRFVSIPRAKAKTG